MSTFKCSNDHDSADPDFCSVCSTEIGSQGGSAVVPAPVAAAVVPAGVCPECQDKHTAEDGPFCQNCGYDFVTGKPSIPGGSALVASVPTPVAVVKPLSGGATGGVAPATSGAAAPGVTSVPAVVASTDTIPTQDIYLYVEVDAAQRGKPDPDAPRMPPRTYDLSFNRNVLGRRAAANVEIVVQKDDSISSRHLEFERQKDGGFKVKDLSSTNGTRLNGADLEANAEYPEGRTLQDGDVLCIGQWTRITIRKRG